MIKHISLIIKHRAERPRKAAAALSRFLRGHGVKITLGRVVPESQAVVVLGGDGTLLHIASKAYQLGIPLLGINLGGLGFLTEVHTDEMEKALEEMLSGTFELDERMMLAITLNRNGENPKTYYALNEAVITKGALAKMITLPTWAGNSFLTVYRGDGLIISTATGSTGYNLSAGGPILHPAIEAFVLTPICPFALSARPLLLSVDRNISIRIDCEPEEISLVIDGQIGHSLREGDRIEIKRAEGYLKLIKSPTRDYFSILREKLGWTKGIRLPQACHDLHKDCKKEIQQ